LIFKSHFVKNRQVRLLLILDFSKQIDGDWRNIIDSELGLRKHFLVHRTNHMIFFLIHVLCYDTAVRFSSHMSFGMVLLFYANLSLGVWNLILRPVFFC